jgi:hypothetical protein
LLELTHLREEYVEVGLDVFGEDLETLLMGCDIMPNGHSELVGLCDLVDVFENLDNLWHYDYLLYYLLEDVRNFN